MLSHVIRSVNRHAFKSLQSQNYVKRFYSNQEFNQKNNDDDYSDKYFRFHDFDDTSRVYQEYYRRYYDNFKNKFDNSGDRQTENDNNGHKNRKKFNNTNYYSFNECKYHVFTRRLIEKIGYIGAAIVVGLHFETPLYYSYRRHRELTYVCQAENISDDSATCPTNSCRDCKFCLALLSKFRILSAPIRKRYIFAKTNYLESSEPKIVEVEETNDQKSQSSSSISSSESLKVEEKRTTQSDPIEDICNQLQTASIDYIDQLNNMLGISLIETDPQQAMRCWSSTKTNPKALFNMGVAYERGLHSNNGVSDLTQAFRYYTLSASMGHRLAIYNLALFYLSGKGGVNVDQSRAESLLRRAAKLGVEPAKNYIEKLEQRRMAQLIQTKKTMRSSASAPNLMVWSYCSDSIGTRNHDTVNNINQSNLQTYHIANRA